MDHIQTSDNLQMTYSMPLTLVRATPNLKLTSEQIIPPKYLLKLKDQLVSNGSSIHREL